MIQNWYVIRNDNEIIVIIIYFAGAGFDNDNAEDGAKNS